MSKSIPLSPKPSQNPTADLSELVEVVRAAAQSREGDCLELLALLRLLNELHYEIRDTLFREALPDNRQRLYRLLKDIEQEGGWPYIRRMKLTALLEHIKDTEGEKAEEEGINPGDRTETTQPFEPNSAKVSPETNFE